MVLGWSWEVLGGPGEAIWGRFGVVPGKYCTIPFSFWGKRAVLEGCFRGYIGGIVDGVEYLIGGKKAWCRRGCWTRGYSQEGL